MKIIKEIKKIKERDEYIGLIVDNNSDKLITDVYKNYENLQDYVYKKTNLPGAMYNFQNNYKEALDKVASLLKSKNNNYIKPLKDFYNSIEDCQDDLKSVLVQLKKDISFAEKSLEKFKGK